MTPNILKGLRSTEMLIHSAYNSVGIISHIIFVFLWVKKDEDSERWRDVGCFEAGHSNKDAALLFDIRHCFNMEKLTFVNFSMLKQFQTS